MPSDEFIRTMIALDKLLCELRLLASEIQAHQQQKHDIVYWKGRLIDAQARLEQASEIDKRTYMCAVLYARKKVEQCEINAGM